MHRTNVDGTDWDATLVQELKQSLQRTNGRGLHADTFLCLVNILLQDVDHITLDLIDSILNLIFVVTLEQLRTSNSSFKARSRDLDTHGALDFLMVLVLAFDSHFLHRIGSQQGSNVRTNRTVKAGDHNSVADMNDTVDEDDVNCSAVTLNNLDFQHSALKLLLFGEIFALGSLTHPAQIIDEIGETLASDSRSRDETERVLW